LWALLFLLTKNTLVNGAQQRPKHNYQFTTLEPYMKLTKNFLAVAMVTTSMATISQTGGTGGGGSGG